jgi:hypothetical protein
VKYRLIYSGELGPQRVALLAVALVFSFAALVLGVLSILPAPHTRTHYLIAGTTPTCIGLVAALVWIERKRIRPMTVVRRVSSEGPR